MFSLSLFPDFRKEMETVKAGMDHNLSDQAYTQVWEECLAQVC